MHMGGGFLSNENQKKKVGRKSAWDENIEPYLDAIKSYARNGYTDAQIAKSLGVHPGTFSRIKREKNELYEALRESKIIADLNIENSLYKRALGCEITETIKDEILRRNDKGELKSTGKAKIRVIKRELPPDVKACNFWLKNRLTNEWRDKRDYEVTGKDGGNIPIGINWIKSSGND